MSPQIELNKAGEVECNECGGPVTEYPHQDGIRLTCDLCDFSLLVSQDAYFTTLRHFTEARRSRA